MTSFVEAHLGEPLNTWRYQPITEYQPPADRPPAYPPPSGFSRRAITAAALFGIELLNIAETVTALISICFSALILIPDVIYRLCAGKQLSSLLIAKSANWLKSSLSYLVTTFTRLFFFNFFDQPEFVKSESGSCSFILHQNLISYMRNKASKSLIHNIAMRLLLCISYLTIVPIYTILETAIRIPAAIISIPFSCKSSIKHLKYALLNISILAIVIPISSVLPFIPCISFAKGKQ